MDCNKCPFWQMCMVSKTTTVVPSVFGGTAMIFSTTPSMIEDCPISRLLRKEQENPKE